LLESQKIEGQVLTRLWLHSLALLRHGHDRLNSNHNKIMHMNKQVTVDEWTAMFREIGLVHAKMEQWHKVFETRHPTGHQSFLEWLGLPPKDVERIRTASK
jgi:hypothetical protein